jgi:hypothetical protein
MVRPLQFLLFLRGSESSQQVREVVGHYSSVIDRFIERLMVQKADGPVTVSNIQEKRVSAAVFSDGHGRPFGEVRGQKNRALMAAPC